MVHGGVSFDVEANRVFAHGGAGFDAPINRIHGHNGSEWSELWPDAGSTPLPPGTYILPPISLSLPPTEGADAFAMFNTSIYQGRITEVYARISWGIAGARPCNVRGRLSGTSYRNISEDFGFANRTIDHRLDTFSTSVLPQFNDGSAEGYRLVFTEFIAPVEFVDYLRLRIEIV